MMDANQVWNVDEAIRCIKELSVFRPHWIEEPTSPDDVLGHATIARSVAPVRVATGEHCHSRVMFKQLLQAGAIRFCQIDSCRLGGVNEVLAVLLMAAKFGVPIARTLGNGLSFENCARLVEHFGVARTSRLLLTGGFIDAAEAAASGAVTKLTEPGEIAQSVADLVAAIASNAPRTIRAARAARSRLRLDPQTAGGEVAGLVADCYASADFREGVSAFLAKRPPKFTGR